jgi:predicted Zn-dependent protease
MTRAQLGQLGLGLGMILSETIAKYGEVVGTGMQLLFLKYGRDDEREADELGFRYMTRLQYDPRGMSDVMRMLNSTSPADNGGMPSWLSTHPDPGDRVATNDQRIAQAGTAFTGYTLNRDAFLQRLNGMVFGADPRNGYFIGTRFLQPTLRLELTVPAGWATQNGAQAVMALSPAKDAAMQLSFAEASSAAEALSKFGSAQGVTIVGSSAQTVNGLTARRAEFDMQGQSGIIHGYLMYVEHGGNVYEVVGYGAPAGWSANAPTLGQALGSFRNLADARYLDVAPHRLQIVRLPAALTFEQYLQRYPSTIDADEVRLINQVAAGERLPAGRLLKRVTGGRVPTQ